MASGDSPAVARRRVRLALREAREAKELTQSQVADAMEWSLSKVMRIESGEVTVSLNDLRPLLAHLGITDPARVDDLVRSARASKQRRQWWDEPQYRENLTLAMRQLIQYETEATAVRHFYAMIVPGRLQIPAYAEAILSKFRGELSDREIEVRLESRMRRRREFLARKDPPEIFLLLDESVLYRGIGGAQVAAEQLRELIRLTKESKLSVRVVPFNADVPMPMFGAYEILNLSGDDDNAIMYHETHLVDEIVEDRAKVSGHRDMFEQLWSAALDDATSVRLIEEHMKPTRSSARRRSPG